MRWAWLVVLGAGASPVLSAQEAPAPAPLAGTSWHLAELSTDGTRIVPDDGSRYRITFGTDGQARMQVDCNQAHGAWHSSGPGQVTFGPNLASTLKLCAAGSGPGDRFLHDLPHVRSYELRNGHLFLSLRPDGGTYEFKPFP